MQVRSKLHIKLTKYVFGSCSLISRINISRSVAEYGRSLSIFLSLSFYLPQQTPFYTHTQHYIITV